MMRAPFVCFHRIRLPAAKCSGDDFLPAVSRRFTLELMLTILLTFVMSPFLQASNNSLPPSLDSVSKLWLLWRGFLVAILACQPQSTITQMTSLCSKMPLLNGLIKFSQSKGVSFGLRIWWFSQGSIQHQSLHGHSKELLKRISVNTSWGNFYWKLEVILILYLRCTSKVIRQMF